MIQRKYIKLSVLLLWFMPYFGINAWWDLCIQDGNCESQSSWYTQPYCHTNETWNVWCIFTNLSKILATKYTYSEREVIKQYCDAMLSTGQNKWRVYYAKASPYGDNTWDWEQTFDSRQSLFVYALCSSFKDEKKEKPFITIESNLSEVLGWDIAKTLKLQQRSQGKDKCSWESSNNLDDCDMSIYATEIFSSIMSDMFKIKYAQALSVDSSENFADVEERITAFFLWYFFITDDYKKLKDLYPKTVDVVNSNQTYYKKVLDTVKILNNEELANIENNLCATWWNVAWKDFVKCAMHWSQRKGHTLEPSFLTLFYNEILNYQIFEKTYQWWLGTKLPLADEKKWREYESKIMDLQLYANMQIDAAYRTLHDLEELNMTYPLHIWLLLYQEKIKRFRDKSLSPVITLFYSLSEKLQNVQFPNS